MAATALSPAKVVFGRIKTIDFLKTEASVWGRTGLKDSVIETCEETPIDNEIELDDGQIVFENGVVSRLEMVLTLPELDSTEIDTIETADEVQLVTAEGGSNGTGVTFSMDIDYIRAVVSGLKTRVRMIAQDTEGSRTWTVTSNAA